MNSSTPKTLLATRLSFLIAGFGMSCWAPLIPLVKARLNADEALLGLLLLCVGIGSLIAMPSTGALSARYGARPIILSSAASFACTLPLLALAPTPLLLALALFLFGAFLAALDVAINIHAIFVERAAKKPLMSGFHAFFSMGGILGALLMSLLILVLPLFIASILCSAMMLIALKIAAPHFIATIEKSDEKTPLFVMPKGVVLVLAALAAVMFLVEGAMLDWSALFMRQMSDNALVQGGFAYMIFSIAMTIGRFSGNAVSAHLGDRATLLWGGFFVLGGFCLLLLMPSLALRVSGFFAIGLGASNLVPVFFRQAGSQTVMPAAFAVAAVTSVGYAGILMGPAAIGFIAQSSSLYTAFWMLAALSSTVPLYAYFSKKSA